MADVTGTGSGEPASHWFAIVPNDRTDLMILPRGIYVGVTGAVAMHDIDGNEAIFVALAVGFHPVRPRRILATGTAATNILGLY
jgi:hypothetical protein